MGDEFVPSAPRSAYTSLTTLATGHDGKPDNVALSKGFLADEPDNEFKDAPLPRYVVSGRNLTTDEDVKISSPKLTRDGRTNGRTIFFDELAEYFETHPDKIIAVRFTETPGSRYIGVEVADQ